MNEEREEKKKTTKIVLYTNTKFRFLPNLDILFALLAIFLCYIYALLFGLLRKYDTNGIQS